MRAGGDIEEISEQKCEFFRMNESFMNEMNLFSYYMDEKVPKKLLKIRKKKSFSEIFFLCFITISQCYTC